MINSVLNLWNETFERAKSLLCLERYRNKCGIHGYTAFKVLFSISRSCKSVKSEDPYIVCELLCNPSLFSILGWLGCQNLSTYRSPYGARWETVSSWWAANRKAEDIFWWVNTDVWMIGDLCQDWGFVRWALYCSRARLRVERQGTTTQLLCNIITWFLVDRVAKLSNICYAKCKFE